MEECRRKPEVSLPSNYCDWYWETPICWPTTPYNTTLSLPCPQMRGSDPTKIISKYCGLDGRWRASKDEKSSQCFIEEVLQILAQAKQLPKGGFELRMRIVRLITILEVLGLTFSLLLVVGCLLIYFFFKKIRNDRTRIHMHLLAAVFCSVVTKLIIILDQLFVGNSKSSINKSALHSTSIVCEFLYVILENSKSTVHMWMFVEAYHLYHACAVTATPMQFRNIYLFIGWGVPIIFVSNWAIAMAFTHHDHCWFAYNYNALFWIIEGPRFLTLIINTYFLIKILIVIFVQLRKQVSNEMEQLRKTARATITLLPLLGITNYLSYAEPPIDGPLWYFILYCLVAYFFTSFHGAFVSLLYFLLTEEVKKIVIHRNKPTSTETTNDNRRDNRDSNKSQKQSSDESRNSLSRNDHEIAV